MTMSRLLAALPLRAWAGLLCLMLAAGCGGGGDDAAPAPPERRALAVSAALEAVALRPSMLSAVLLPGFSAGAAVDGDIATPAWHVDHAPVGALPLDDPPGARLTIDLGRRVAVARWALYMAATPPATLYYIQHSDDGVHWRYADGAGFVLRSAGWTQHDLGIGTGAHRWWRLGLQETAAPTGPWVTELALWSEAATGWAPLPAAAATPTQSGLSAWSPAALADGNLGDGAWHTDAAGTGAWLAADFGTPVAARQVNAWRFDGCCTSTRAQYDVQWSDDGAGWHTVAMLWLPLPGWNGVGWADAGAHRHWRLRLQFAPGPGPWVGEWEWLAADPGPGGTPWPPASLAAAGLSGWIPAGLADGDVSTHAWHTDTATAGAEVAVDLGTPRAVATLALFRHADSTPGFEALYRLQGSDDGVAWADDLAPTFGLPVPGWNRVPLQRPATYRHWRLVLQNTPGPAAWIDELALLP